MCIKRYKSNIINAILVRIVENLRMIFITYVLIYPLKLDSIIIFLTNFILIVYIPLLILLVIFTNYNMTITKSQINPII